MGNTASSPPQCQPGCSPSSPISQAISQVQGQQPTVTPDPVSQCEANKIVASALQNQLNQKNSQIDQCDPSIPLARTEKQIETDNNNFVSEARKNADEFIYRINDKFKMGNDLAEAVKELKHYEKDIKKELEDTEKNLSTLYHNERKYRRDFLDNQPTAGVPWHIFGLQTSDDKVMLTFWISALISFSLLAHVGLTIAQPNSTLKTRAMIGSIVVIAALIACQILISYNG